MQDREAEAIHWIPAWKPVLNFIFMEDAAQETLIQMIHQASNPGYPAWMRIIPHPDY